MLDIGDDIDLCETEEDTRDTEIPDAQPAWQNPAPQPTRERVMKNSVENQLGARSSKPSDRKRKLETPNCHQSQGGKKPLWAMEVMSLNTNIERSETAIRKLRAHIKERTCPKTLRYNESANITPDKQFKKGLGSIRKTVEQEFTRTSSKFHQRYIYKVNAPRLSRNCLARKTKRMLFKLEKAGRHRRLEMKIHTWVLMYLS